jgi:hypothetical protein
MSTKRKGHIFSLDILIALLILVLGLVLVFYKYPIKNQSYYFNDQLSNDMVLVLSDTHIKDLCINPALAGCSCPNYIELDDLVCKLDYKLKDTDANLLSAFTEIIENEAANNKDIENVIKEIFVDHNVIDEKRFGFAVIYTTPSEPAPFELYNSDR